MRQRAGRMSVRLWRDDASLAFAIEHDGLALPASGSGSARTSQDRMAALGGELRTEPTRLTGTIPLTA